MSRYSYTDTEREINAVLVNQDRQLKSVSTPDMNRAERAIADSEALLRSLGYDLPCTEACLETSGEAELGRRRVVIAPSWEETLEDAMNNGTAGAELEGLFTEEEIARNGVAIRFLNEEYNQIHRLDVLDVVIAVGAGLLSAAVDMLLVGVPKKTCDGLSAAPLSDFIRRHIEGALTPKQRRELEGAAKVPYDAPCNAGFTGKRVEGLYPGMHRLYSLGHDPLLGLVVGVSDILTGRMTTIDKNGRVISQVIDRYADRVEKTVVQALIKQITHFFSDVTTPAGLPVPCMALFNLMQFGSIGEERATIADVVQGMYWGGYDFVHFCSMSIPVAVSEIFVRFAYTMRRAGQGVPVKEAASSSVSRQRNPKLATMLFLAHACATAANAGKVYFAKNPLAINYPQWIAFAKYSYQQVRWNLFEKSSSSDKYVRGVIGTELDSVYCEIDESFETLAAGAVVL